MRVGMQAGPVAEAFVEAGGYATGSWSIPDFQMTSWEAGGFVRASAEFRGFGGTLRRYQAQATWGAFGPGGGGGVILD